MPRSIPRPASPRYILLIAAALLAWFAIALAVLPGRSAEAVSKGVDGQGRKSGGNLSVNSKRDFTEPLALLPPAPDTLAAWSFEGVTTTNTGQTPTISVGSATADSGVLTAGSSFTGFHTSPST